MPPAEPGVDGLRITGSRLTSTISGFNIAAEVAGGRGDGVGDGMGDGTGDDDAVFMRESLLGSTSSILSNDMRSRL